MGLRHKKVYKSTDISQRHFRSRQAAGIHCPPLPPSAASTCITYFDPLSSHSPNNLGCGEQTNPHLPDIEVDKPGGLVGHKASEVAPNEAVPRSLVLLLDLRLDGGGNLLLRCVIYNGIL